jgi:hypothetical protein
MDGDSMIKGDKNLLAHAIDGYNKKCLGSKRGPLLAIILISKIWPD